MEKYISMLVNLPFFAGISPKEMGVLLQSLAAVEERFEKGQVLYRQGDRLKRMGIVLEGSLSLEREDIRGGLRLPEGPDPQYQCDGPDKDKGASPGSGAGAGRKTGRKKTERESQGG